MSKKGLLRQRSGLLLTVLLLAGCSGTPFHPTAIPPIPTPTTKLLGSPSGPQPGIWNATAEFGEFIFVVNSTGTGVNEYDFGGINIKTSDDEGYPIKDSKFGSMLDFIMIEGKFDSSTTASGTWKYLKKGGSGTWTAIWSHSAASTPKVSTAVPVSSPTSASPHPSPVPTNIAETYLSQFQPTLVELPFGEYSVGTFAFTSPYSEDPIREGDPIVIHNVKYSHGIFAHAPSRLVYDIGGTYEQLSATLGLVDLINNGVSCGDGVNFVVLLDGREIYRSNRLDMGSEPVDILLPIAGGYELTLTVENGGSDDSDCDWAIWGNPRLR